MCQTTRNTHFVIDAGLTGLQNNYSLKLNQASHAAWNSPNLNPNSQSQQLSGAASSVGFHPI